jgi:hypothetical protein
MLFAQVGGPTNVSMTIASAEDSMITYQTIMTTTIMVNIIEQMTITKLMTSLSKVVKPVFGVFVIFAILPKTVESPVDTTIPVPLPDMQCVP